MSAISILRDERDKLSSRRDAVQQTLTQLSNDTAMAQNKLDQLRADIQDVRNALATLGAS